MSYLYHTTKKKNRGAIRRYGLLPRDTNEYNYVGIGYQPVGVFTTREDAPLFLHMVGKLGPECDVWKINAAGLEVVPDKIVEYGRVITERVAPERLTLHGVYGMEQSYYTLKPEDFIDGVLTLDKVRRPEPISILKNDTLTTLTLPDDFDDAAEDRRGKTIDYLDSVRQVVVAW